MKLAESARPSWRSAASGLVSWRGPDGDGAPLGLWAAALALSWIIAWLYAPWQPLLLVVPPFLALAIAWPALGAAGERAFSGPSARAFEWGVATLVLGLVLLQFYGESVIRKELPIDGADNQMMLMRAQIFANALRHARWDRWTFLLQAGESLTDLYPFLFDLLVGLASLILPVSLVTTYTIVVLLVIFGRGLATYALARRFAGRGLSLVIAAAVMVDHGNTIWDGGSHSTIYWGLVHSHFGITLATVALTFSIDLVRETSDRAFVLCALAAGVAAFTHPVGLLFLSIWLVALALVLVLGRGERRRLAWACAALALGLALPAGFVLPSVYALREHGFSAALPGFDYVTLAPGFLHGNEPGSSYGMMVGVGAVAVLAAVASGEPALIVGGLCVLLCFAYWLTPMAVQIRLLDYASSLLMGQPKRMTPLMKTAALPAMAWLLSKAFDRGPVAGSLRVRPVLTRTLVFALALLGPGRALLVGEHEVANQLTHLFDRPPELIKGTRVPGDEVALFDWIAAQRKADPNPTQWRMAVSFSRRWRHTLWKQALRTNVPITDFGWIAGNFLTYRPREKTAIGMRDWSIRYVLTENAIPPFPGVTQRFHTGTLWLWEVNAYDGKAVVAPPGVAISGLRYEPDTIRFTVAGAPPAGVDLQVRSAWFPRWRARQGGRKLEVVGRQPRPDAKPKQEQIALHAGNGEVVLTCDGPIPRGRLGMMVSLLALGAVFAGTRAERRARIEAELARLWSRARAALTDRLALWRDSRPLRLAAVLRRRWPVTLAASFVLLLLLGVGLRLRGTTRLRVSPWEGTGFEATLVEGAHRTPCRRSFWLGRAECDRQTSVDMFVGETKVGDDTEEYAPLWPGIRMVAQHASSVVELRWPGARLAGQTLALRVFSTIGFHVQYTAGAIRLADRTYVGSAEERLVIPSPAPRLGPLTIRLESFGAGSLVLDGTLSPTTAPAPPHPPTVGVVDLPRPR